MKRTAVIISAFFLLAFTIVTNPLLKVPAGWPKPAYDFSRNPLTKEKVLLGRVLFYDPVVSKDGKVSCASCHSPFSAFTHTDHALSHGIHDSIGTRNSPALMNLAWQNTFMWDGAINNLDMQALAPISHPAEMGSSINELVAKLQSLKLYRNLYHDAFGDSSITGERTLKALSQFMLTLVTANSKYDKVKRHEETFTTQEENGYRLFKRHCASCHTEPLFTSNGFANNGLAVDSFLKDYGKIKISRQSTDSLKFKVPTLRNIEYTYPYMHDGRFKKLSEVLNHYAQGIQQGNTLAPQLKTDITLTSNQKVDLIAFLLTLSDKEFVFKPEFGFPKHVLLRP